VPKFSLGTGSQVTTKRPPRFSRLRAVGVAGANSPDTVSRKRIATCTPWSNCRRSIYLQPGWPLTMAIFSLADISLAAVEQAWALPELVPEWQRRPLVRSALGRQGAIVVTVPRP
jgi:hypothetical protein